MEKIKRVGDLDGKWEAWVSRASSTRVYEYKLVVRSLEWSLWKALMRRNISPRIRTAEMHPKRICSAPVFPYEESLIFGSIQISFKKGNAEVSYSTKHRYLGSGLYPARKLDYTETIPLER